MKLNIVDSSKYNKEFLEKVAEAAFSCMEKVEGEIELKFVTEEEIQELNNKYRKVNKPTDVLSFTISKKPLIGQIFICYNIARVQAEELNYKFDDEIALLLTHGILHVFGYDHLDESEAEVMEKAEKDILAKIGVNR